MNLFEDITLPELEEHKRNLKNIQNLLNSEDTLINKRVSHLCDTTEFLLDSVKNMGLELDNIDNEIKSLKEEVARLKKTKP